MNTQKDWAWFKETVIPRLSNYEIEYKFFEKGDFGSLNRIGFNNELKGGYVDFWSLGWINIYLVDYVKGNELMNLLMEPTEEEKINDGMEELLTLL